MTPPRPSCFSEYWRNTDGSSISYIPKRDRAKYINNAAIKIFTHGLAANWLAPEAPNVNANIIPRIENVAIIPKV